MRKKIYLALLALPLAGSLLVGCDALHVHTFTTAYEHDETSHWKTCSVCHKKFENHEHVWNEFNDSCLICEYHDPLVHIDETGMVTGLTAHGKDKLTFEIPHKVGETNVTSIDHHAFDGAKAVTVKLNKELREYYLDSFPSTVRIVTSEEGDAVQWVTDGDKKVKHDNYEAMVDGVYYEKLKDAFNSVKVGDTTVTLLKENLVIGPDPIEVNHSITLVSYYSSATLECDFNITPSGILYIPETISYKGEAQLLLSLFEETRAKNFEPSDGSTTDTVYNTGSLVFTHKDKLSDQEKENIKVNYVQKFGPAATRWEAFGAKQVVNDVLVVPVNHFAYGTFRFTTDFLGIKGLTEYGQTVTHLQITKVLANHPLNIKSSICDYSFTIPWRVYVPVDLFGNIEDIYFRFFRSKGLFTELTIGEGIGYIGECAFNNRIDGDIDKQLAKWIYPVFSHLLKVTLGDDLVTIDEKAFYENVGLKTIGGGANLESIGTEAFRFCSNLSAIDFSQSAKLQTIGARAFEQCQDLAQVFLPTEYGIWMLGDSIYFPYDMTPEMIAHYMVKNDNDGVWKRTSVFSTSVSYTVSTAKDSLGRFKNIAYSFTLTDALENCADGGEVYISSGYSGSRSIDYSKIKGKNITITASEDLDDITIRNGTDDIVINPGKYLMLSNVTSKNNIVLKAETKQLEVGGQQVDVKMANNAGFAIRNVDEDKLPEVTIEHNTESISYPASSNLAAIRDRYYDVYGLNNFNYNESTNATELHTLSNLGKLATNVTFGNQIKMDGSHAELTGHINGGNNMVYATLADDVTSISRTFFGGNTQKMEELTCGAGLENIGVRAFVGCIGLSQVDLSRAVNEVVIGEEAFGECEKLTSVNFPKKLKSIGENAFYKCTGISSVDLTGEEMDSIGASAFDGCTNLETLTLPDKLGSIGNSAFSGCRNLSTIRFPNELDSIGENAFKNCNALTKVNLYGKVGTIGASAFEGCENVTTVSLSSDLTEIGENAFKGCTRLIKVILPEENKLQKIGANAFKDSTLLIMFSFGNNTVGWEAGETPLESDKLIDEFEAANLIKQYKDKEWVRS